MRDKKSLSHTNPAETHYQFLNQELDLVRQAYPLGTELSWAEIPHKRSFNGKVCGYTIQTYATKSIILLEVRHPRLKRLLDPNYELLKLRKSRNELLVSKPPTVTNLGVVK